MESTQEILAALGAAQTVGNVNKLKEWAATIVDGCGNIVIGKDEPMKHAETISNLQAFKKKIY